MFLDALASLELMMSVMTLLTENHRVTDRNQIHTFSSYSVNPLNTIDTVATVNTVNIVNTVNTVNTVKSYRVKVQGDF